MIDQDVSGRDPAGQGVDGRDPTSDAERNEVERGEKAGPGIVDHPQA